MATQEPQTNFLTVGQIAKRWNCSEEKVTRIFRGRKGVIDLGSAEDFKRRKRRYSILRIPPEVLARVEAEFSN